MKLPSRQTSAGSPTNPVATALNRRQFLTRAAALWPALGTRTDKSVCLAGAVGQEGLKP